MSVQLPGRPLTMTVQPYESPSDSKGVVVLIATHGPAVCGPQCEGPVVADQVVPGSRDQCDELLHELVRVQQKAGGPVGPGGAWPPTDLR